MTRLMSVFLLVVAACGGSDGGSNLADAGASLDAPTGSSDASAAPGLTVQWVAAPAIPGPQQLSTMVNVTSAKFHLKKLEVIGDGGALPETTQDEFDVLWDATHAPPSIFFTTAPPAIYSKVRLGFDKGSSNAPSIEISGTVLVNGTTEMFRVTSTQKTDVEVGGYSVRLDLGEFEGMPIIVGLDALLADVNWMALPTPGGVRTLDDTSTQAMDSLLDHLEYTFSGPLE